MNAGADLATTPVAPRMVSKKDFLVGQAVGRCWSFAFRGDIKDASRAPFFDSAFDPSPPTNEPTRPPSQFPLPVHSCRALGGMLRP